MKISHIFQSVIAGMIVITIVAMAGLLPAFPAFAGSNQSNQAMNRSALLVSPDRKAKINIYARPDRHQRRIGFGISGDRVIVLEQVGSNEGDTWNHIRLSNTSSLEGWVRQDFLLFQDSGQPSGDRASDNRQNTQQNYQRRQND